ncbi:LOW QUALITY PROTEIN: beta-1,3-galactosyl-O-glycosyl-glycoprotein beta-1,6-N-acetylglucosaminyltransferase 7-like [Rhynchonycteris naso]
MSQLRASKPGVLLCTAICISIFVYLRNSSPEESKKPTYPAVVECGFYPDKPCSALFEGKGAAPHVAKFCKNTHESEILAHPHTPGNCSRMTQGLHFISRPLSAEEGNFSLAYVMAGHKELAMFAQLLRATYVPQNVYCIHLDVKAPQKHMTAVQTLVNCFENIFISSKREKGANTGFLRLQTEINCMKDLVHSKFQWNYVINLCRQDFPIKTNREIIHHIRSKRNDKNSTPGVIQLANIKSKTSQSHPKSTPEGNVHVSPNKGSREEPPHNLTVYFGNAHYVLTRKFVQFVLTDIRARDMFQWSKDIHCPERHYWATLNRMRGENNPALRCVCRSEVAV